MKKKFFSTETLTQFSLWEKQKTKGGLLNFSLELTARCNLNCKHCYVNLPASDKTAQKAELSLEQIKKIATQAVELGAVWCLITGGEPLLRPDFFDIYLYLKKLGLLVSVFTNATLINQKHIDLFKNYPPRDIEVTVYGVTPKTYENVTKTPGSFETFMRGLKLLLDNKIKVRLKAMALRSNVQELPKIACFCKKYTKDYFRFDPLIQLRSDRNKEKNKEIKSERLPPEKIAEIEKQDRERFSALLKGCDKLINPDFTHYKCNHLFHCGTGVGSFYITYDGFFRLCSSLSAPECMFDLKKGTVKEAYEKFVPKVRDLRSNNPEFLKKCRKCPIINLCLWCPAHAYLETGKLDSPVKYFCEVAHARAQNIQKNKSKI